ncbi:MAG: glycerate kinase [Chitinophagales bacterium]|nr:glycerate kinase [Hyphomicrobiales bacterium]
MHHTSLDSAQRATLLDLFRVSVEAAHPNHCLEAHWPEPPSNGRLIIIAAGKAAAAMGQAAERHYAPILGADGFSGIVVTRHGFGAGAPLSRLELIEAGHPVPDSASAMAAARLLAIASDAKANDLVLVLMSGGASALLASPAQGLTLADKQALTRELLRCGATISEINCVRKHLSGVKGGKLARAAFPAKLIALAISDVKGDAPDAIGSGPTVPDPTTLADARAVLVRYGLTPPPAIADALQNASNETPKPGDALFANTSFTVTASPRQAIDAAAARLRALGYEPILLGDNLEGEARAVATWHALVALEVAKSSRRAAILSGGELTVTVTGNGRGGPNQEYALALAIALKGAPNISALAADTDGTDGGGGEATDPAGAMIGPHTLARAQARGRDAATFLNNNDSTGFFSSLGDLVQCGPTQTNVNDIRAILVEPGARDS